MNGKLIIGGVLFVLLACLSCIGCGDGGGGGDSGPDAGTDTDTDTDSDADTDTDADAGTDTDTDTDTDTGSDATLTLSGAFTTDCVTGLASGGTTVISGSAENSGRIKIVWSDGGMKQFSVEVYGVLDAPTAPGTYNIAAVDTSYATCSLCILVYDETAIYMPIAESGTITLTDYNLTAPEGTTFSGSLDVDLQEVTINESTYETIPVTDGCTGAITGDWTGTVDTPWPI